MTTANERQVGGDHYRKHGATGEQHWDRQWRLFGPGYFVGCITKYVERYRDKGGIQDLEKARHFLDKLIELEQAEWVRRQGAKAGSGVAARTECDHDYDVCHTPNGVVEVCLKCTKERSPDGRGAGPLWDADDVQPADRSGS